MILLTLKAWPGSYRRLDDDEYLQRGDMVVHNHGTSQEDSWETTFPTKNVGVRRKQLREGSFYARPVDPLIAAMIEVRKRNK